MSKQKGFTLIELIVVIVILGILAATALPKFIDLSSDARTAVMKGVEGSMRGANAMLYGRAAAAGVQSAATATISATSTISVSLAYGYAANTSELAKVMDLSPTEDFDTTGTNTIQHRKATIQSSCQVEYTPAGSPGATPVYKTTSSGC